MNDLQQRTAAKQFADHWKGRGYEKGESQPFWLSLLDRTSFIDGYINSTHVLD